jgi:hypothetical protein
MFNRHVFMTGKTEREATGVGGFACHVRQTSKRLIDFTEYDRLSAQIGRHGVPSLARKKVTTALNAGAETECV